MGGALNMAMTVLGPLDAADLGWCQCHEHLLVRKGRPAEIDPSQAFDDMEKSAGELAAYRSAGGNTVVDAQPGGCCRMEKELQMISKRSGVHMTIHGTAHRTPMIPKRPRNW
jgi:predicted metal-dependent phosphotriesterase family hydrolase